MRNIRTDRVDIATGSFTHQGWRRIHLDGTVWQKHKKYYLAFKISQWKFVLWTLASGLGEGALRMQVPMTPPLHPCTLPTQNVQKEDALCGLQGTNQTCFPRNTDKLILSYQIAVSKPHAEPIQNRSTEGRFERNLEGMSGYLDIFTAWLWAWRLNIGVKEVHFRKAVCFL